MNSGLIAVIIAVLCLDDKLLSSLKAPQLLSRLAVFAEGIFQCGGLVVDLER